MPRPTRRCGLLVVGAATLFAIGTNIQSGWLIVLASILLGAVIAGIALPRRTVRRLKVARRCPGEATQGEEVLVELDVENTARRGALEVVVEDEHLGPARVLVPSLAPGERVRVSSTRRARRRGVAETSFVRITSAAPFGVAVAARPAEASGRTVVYPEVVSIEDLPLAGSPAGDASSVAAAASRGRGAEYLGVREYRTGDSMRHVHWPSTARTGAVMVREFEREHGPALTVLVDTLADAVPAAHDGRSPLDVSCSIAGSFALAGMRLGRRVTMAASVKGSTELLEPADEEAALAWLAALTAGGGVSMASMLDTIGDLIADPGAIVVSCPAWAANEDLPGSFGDARGGGIVALVELHAYPGRPAARVLTASRLEALEERLRAAGVRCIRVRPDDDLATVLSVASASR